MARHCSICEKPGHNARTCPQAEDTEKPEPKSSKKTVKEADDISVLTAEGFSMTRTERTVTIWQGKKVVAVISMI